MPTRWDRQKKMVVIEMQWEEARDLGQWDELVKWDRKWAKQLVEAAQQGAGILCRSISQQ
jgi:hypothetical protein